MYVYNVTNGFLKTSKKALPKALNIDSTNKSLYKHFPL